MGETCGNCHAPAECRQCDSCQEVADLFLTADDVPADELGANQGVIVEEIPPLC